MPYNDQLHNQSHLNPTTPPTKLLQPLLRHNPIPRLLCPLPTLHFPHHRHTNLLDAETGADVPPHGRLDHVARPDQAHGQSAQEAIPATRRIHHFGRRAVIRRQPPRQPLGIGDEGAVFARADDHRQRPRAGCGHGGEQARATLLDDLSIHAISGGVVGVDAAQVREFGVIGADDVDVGAGLERVCQLGGHAEVRHRFPDEQRGRETGVEGCAAGLDAQDQLDAAEGRADEVEGL